jgi:hypothetical protein
VKGKIIFCTHGFSNDIYKVGSHHYAIQLKNNGFEVLNISSPISIFHFITLFSKSRRYRFLLKFKTALKFLYKTSNEYFEYIPISFLPFRIKGLLSNDILLKHQEFFIPFLNFFLSHNNFNEIDYLVIENPKLLFFKNIIKHKKLIYRITDIYPEFGNTKINKLQNQIFNDVDIFFITSKNIENYLKSFKISSKKIFLIENGVDAKHYLSNNNLLLANFRFEHLIPSNKLNIVYVGALDDRIDYNLIFFLINKFPQHNFYFFGTIDDISVLKIINNKINSFFLGPISYDILPTVLSKFHVGLLPFILNDINNSRSPMKLYEYGISGLTVLSKYTIDLCRKKEPFVILCKDFKDFEIHLSNNDLIRKPFSEIAIQRSILNSWEYKCKEFVQIISNA